MKRLFLVLGPTVLGSLIVCSGAPDLDLFATDGQQNIGDDDDEDSGVDLDDAATKNDGAPKKDATTPPGKDAGPPPPPPPDASIKDSSLPDTFDANKACNVTLNSKTVIASDCEDQFLPTYNGGKLTSGHYELEALYILGDKATCQNFASTDHYSAIDLEADAIGDNATMQFVHSSGGVETRATFTLASPGVTQTLTVSQTCPVIAGPAQWKYDTNGKNGKRFRYEASVNGTPVVYVYVRP